MKKKNKNITPERIEQIINVIAEQNHTTAENVRLEMIKAMSEGMNNPDPAVQATWNSIPHEGDVPTLEELIIWTANRLK